MFVGLGEETRLVVLGYAADWCPRCGEARRVVAARTQNRLVLFFVLPVTAWWRVAAGVRCSECQSTWPVQEQEFAGFVPDELEIVDLIERTQPALAERQLEVEEWLEALGAGKLMAEQRARWVDRMVDDAQEMVKRPTAFQRIMLGLGLFAYFALGLPLLSTLPALAVQQANGRLPSNVLGVLTVAATGLGWVVWGLLLWVMVRAYRKSRHSAAVAVLMENVGALRLDEEEWARAREAGLARGRSVVKFVRAGAFGGVRV